MKALVIQERFLLQAESGEPFKKLLDSAIEHSEADEYSVEEARKILHSVVNARHDRYLVQHGKKPPKGQRGVRKGRGGMNESRCCSSELCL